MKHTNFLKKFLAAFVLIMFSLGIQLAHPLSVDAQDETSIFKINKFQSVIKFSGKDDIVVTEKIEAEFFIERHGILRDIPVNFHTGNPLMPNVRIDVFVKSVTDAEGNGLTYEVESLGDYKRIRIGDADKFVTGVQNYHITYEATNAVNFFEEWDELYWNVTGDQWPVNIEQAETIIYLPEATSGEKLKVKCFTGVFGSTTENCSFQFFNADLQDSTNNEVEAVRFFSNNALPTNNGLTVVLGIPKGQLTEPTFWEEYWLVIFVNLGVCLPLPVLLIMLLIKARKSANARGRGTIMPEFDAPDKLTPAEVGTLVDNFAENKDISAIVIDLAIRGYIQLEELEKKFLAEQDYNFHLLKSDFAGLKAHELELLEGIFGADPKKGKTVKLSSLKYIFADHMQTIKSNLYNNLASDGYFAQNPNEIRGLYIGIAIGFLVVFGGITMLLLPLGAILTLFGVVVSAIILFIFAFIMPTRTSKGVLALEHILGLKYYLKTAETDRLKVMQGPNSEFIKMPNKSIKLFEKLLPYAMVLGVEKEWAGKFQDIYKTPPNWYSGSNWNNFTAYHLTQSLNNATNSMGNTFVSQYSSSAGGGSGFSGGGGSSGGGGGGGGGGSW
jgi:uncharacterized membrane protein